MQLSGRSTLGDALSDAIKSRLKIQRVRCDTFGYLQRSFLGVLSDVDSSEARDVGETAVHFAVHRGLNGSVAIRRTGDYSVDYFVTPLDTVAGIKAELLLHFAGNDDRINADWPAYEAALKAAGVRYEAHTYAGTQHAFNNDTTPRYDSAAAALAWQRTLAFFNRTLRG